MNNKYEGYPGWYREIQDKSEELSGKMEWPDARLEKWRRTELKRIDLGSLYNDPPQVPDRQRSSPMTSIAPAADSRHISLCHLSDAVRGDYPGVRELIQNLFENGDNRFIYRLLAEPPRGLYLYLPANYRSKDMLFLEDNIIRLARGESFSLNLVVMEEGAQVDLWERIGSKEPALLHNRATLILQKANSRLNYYRTQTLPEDSGMVDFSRVILYGGARFDGSQAEKDIRFAKSHVSLELRERKARAELRGIYQVGGDRFCEIFTEQIHLAPQCESRSLYRGVLEDRARSVYNGMIEVSSEAVKTDAYLTNNNLLMNDGCRADSIPGLKIATNDVKCSHGSTTGKVDRNQLFYLQSRGFSEGEAKGILTRAFLEEVLGGVPDLVKEELRAHWKWAGEEVLV